MKNDYDYIVLGCGGIGSAAAYWLARRKGSDVLVLEQFPLFHNRGSSQDHSRAIRLCYFDQIYVQLAVHSFIAWSTVEEESGVKLVHKTGGVYMFSDENSSYRGASDYRKAMDAVGIPYETGDATEVMKRYPQFRIKENIEALFQADSGLVDPNKAIASQVSLAQQYGARVVDNCAVPKIVDQGDRVTLTTQAGVFTCRKLIVAAGAWTDTIMAQFGLKFGITVTQEQVGYFRPKVLKDFCPGRFPVFFWKGKESVYGFPVYGETATKAGLDAIGPVVTPDNRSFEAVPDHLQRLETWIDHHIPNFRRSLLQAKTCLYDIPRDRNFILDTLPGHDNIVVCSGAAHAFKFSCVLGKIMSELAIDGRTPHSITEFSAKREAVTNASFKERLTL